VKQLKASQIAKEKALREIEQERLQAQQKIEESTPTPPSNHSDTNNIVITQSERVMLKLLRGEPLDQGDRVYLASQLSAITILAGGSR
jgi:hypothetical protein